MKIFKKFFYFITILIIIAGIGKSSLYFYRINQIKKYTDYNENYILGKNNKIITLETWVGYEEPYSRKLETIMQELQKKYPNYINRYIRYAPLTGVYPKEKIAIRNLECLMDQNKDYFDVLHKILATDDSQWDYFLRLDILNLKKLTNENKILKELDVEKFYDCSHSEEKDFIVKNAQAEMNKSLGKDSSIPVTIIRNNLTGETEGTIMGAQPSQEYIDRIENVLENTVWWKKI